MSRNASDDSPFAWLLDDLVDGVLFLDASGTLRFVNGSAARVLGVDPGTVVGRSLADIESHLPEEWRKPLRLSFEQEARVALPPARVMVNDREMAFRGEVHPAPEGGVGVVLRDTTSRIERDETLRLRDRAMAASPNPIILTDATLPDQPVIYVNPAFERVTGYPADEVIGRNCRFLQGDDRDQEGARVVRRAVDRGESCRVVLRNYRKDGSRFWNELHISPVVDEEGQVTHFVGIQDDITGRKRMEEALVERNRELEETRDVLRQRNHDLREATLAKDRFLATMSHEMRTPLNAVLGYVEILLMGIAGEVTEEQREHLERIRSTGRHLLDLINDILDLTRAEVGKLEISVKPIEVLPIAEEVLATLEPEARDKGIRLELDPEDRPDIQVMGSRRRLRQIMMNLISNALKFTPEGSVRIGWEELEQEAEIFVRDTGIGIPNNALAGVFEEFFQVDSGHTRQFGGSGLGLTISRRLARLMGGDITVESTPGEGSTFRLTLPLAGEGGERERRKREPLETTEPAPAPRTKVIIFSDAAAGLAPLAGEAEPGIRVIFTPDADDVPDLALREEADLVVLDVACQDGVGWEVAHEIREDPRLEGVVVMLLPWIPEPSGSPGALDLGFVSIVPKPLTGDQLRRAVREATAGRDPGEEAVRVLVIDDDPDARRIARDLLSREGAEVHAVADGEAGLEAMRSRAPDLAVVDLMMPVLDGFGVIAAMRADPTLRDIPVVVLTAKDLTEAERRFLSRTASEVLEKGEHRLADVATLILRAARVRGRMRASDPE